MKKQKKRNINGEIKRKKERVKEMSEIERKIRVDEKENKWNSNNEKKRREKGWK